MTIDDESVVPTLATLSTEEFEQFGRATSAKSEATFLSLLLALTSDGAAIEAAVRGRRSVLESGGSIVTDDDVKILWRTPAAISARVRSDGIFDVGWTQGRPWSCTCTDEACVHIAATKQLIREGA
jgi:hypothetical protein